VTRQPRIYFSFRSPYSWLSVHRLLAEIPDLFERVEMIPYWDPDPRTDAALRAAGAEFHYVQMSKAKHLYLLHDTKRLAADLGVAMAWPIDIDAWWEPAHLGFLVAARHGVAQRYYAALTEARWGRGERIYDPAVLTAVASAAGLDPALVLGAPEDPDVRAESVGCLVRAYHDDIFGIPYFRVGRHRFWGYDRVDAFLAALRQPATVSVAAPAVPAGYDSDTAGGCG
jgi:2-hydroxychromene-2-carboxylate isomerase